MATVTTAPIPVQELLSYGLAQIGKPYVFGAAGPNTFDCSGLITYMYKHFGISLPHHAADQAKLGTPVPTSNIQAGDLVFSDWGDGPNSHVGIATDPTHILNAPDVGQDVKISTLTPSYKSRITAVRRVGNLTGGQALDSGNLPTNLTNLNPFGGHGVVDPTTGLPPNVDAAGRGALNGGNGDPNIFESVWHGLLSVPEDIGHVFTGAYKELAGPLSEIGAVFTEIGTIADKIFSLFLPSNLIRVVSGLVGVILIFIGVGFLKHEIQS